MIQSADGSIENYAYTGQGGFLEQLVGPRGIRGVLEGRPKGGYEATRAWHHSINLQEFLEL
jgi:hypothetical protein